MSADRFRPIPPDCPTDYVRPPHEPFRPLFFSQPDFLVVGQLIGMLLGEAGEASISQEIAQWVDLRVASAKSEQEAIEALRPSHRALTVAYIGSAQVERLAKANPARICSEGLQWIADKAHTFYSKPFLALETGQQIALLQEIGDDAPHPRAENAGTRFFDYLKPETIRGFYTSRAGLQELDFKGNAFYARSPGCG